MSRISCFLACACFACLPACGGSGGGGGGGGGGGDATTMVNRITQVQVLGTLSENGTVTGTGYDSMGAEMATVVDLNANPDEFWVTLDANDSDLPIDPIDGELLWSVSVVEGAQQTLVEMIARAER